MFLPSGGFYARSGDGRVSVWCGLRNGKRMRWAKSEEYEYWSDPDKEVVRLFGPDGEEVVASAKTAEVVLPYAAASVVGLDEQRHETGDVPCAAEDGRTRIGRVPAVVVSVLVKR